MRNLDLDARRKVRTTSIQQPQNFPHPVSAIIAIAEDEARYAAGADRRPIDGVNQTTLSIAYWDAFGQMLTGESSEQAWAAVTCSLNVALILCEYGIGREYQPYLVTALDGAFRAQLRAARTQRWRFDGEAICAIRNALEIHDDQTKLATKEELRDALAAVRLRVAEGNVYRAAA